MPDEFIELVVYLFTTVLDGRNAHLGDGVQRALGREPRDFYDYAWDTAQQRHLGSRGDRDENDPGGPLIAATVTTGLVAGLLGAFTLPSCPPYADADDRTFVDVMQRINVAIINPVFLSAFVGGLLVTIAAVLATWARTIGASCHGSSPVSLCTS